MAYEEFSALPRQESACHWQAWSPGRSGWRNQSVLKSRKPRSRRPVEVTPGRGRPLHRVATSGDETLLRRNCCATSGRESGAFPRRVRNGLVERRLV